MVWSIVKERRSDSLIFQTSPGSTWPIIEVSRDAGECLTVIFRRSQPRAGGEKFADVLRQPLVNPQKVVFHRLLEIGSCQPGGPTILAVPGMRKFVGQERIRALFLVVVDECAFGNAFVARLVMLKTIGVEIVRQRNKKIIVIVVAGPEKRASLTHQPAIS